MLTFTETQSNAAMEAAIGRRLIVLLRPSSVQFADGGKKCTKGLSCGASCISKAKVCVKSLSPEQQARYRSLVKAVKGGDANAQAEIDSIRQEQQDGDISLRDLFQEADRIGSVNTSSNEVSDLDLANEILRRAQAGEAFSVSDILREGVPQQQREAPNLDSRSSEEIQQSVDDRIKSGDLPKPFSGNLRKFEFVEGIEFETETDINFVGITGSQKLFTREKVMTVSFDINGSYGRGEVTDKREGARIALGVRKAFRDQFKDLPDGLILHNTPFSGDGAGDQRRSLYEKAGFGPPGVDGGMYAVVKDGKLIPLNGPEEMTAYFDSSAKPPRKRRRR